MRTLCKSLYHATLLFPILQPYEGKDGQDDSKGTAGGDAKRDKFDDLLHLDFSTLSPMALWCLVNRVLPEWDVNSVAGREVRTVTVNTWGEGGSWSLKHSPQNGQASR